MAAHSSILAWRVPWTGGAWQARVYRVAELDTTEAAEHKQDTDSQREAVKMREQAAVHTPSKEPSGETTLAGGPPASRTVRQDFPLCVLPRGSPWTGRQCLVGSRSGAGLVTGEA